MSDWEIWNEPNLPRFLGFAERQAAVYTGLLKAAYPAIKSVQPGATVIAAGLSPAVGIDAPPNFLNDMYVNGAKGYLRRNRHASLRISRGDRRGPEQRVVRSGPGARRHDVERGRRQEGVVRTEFGASTSAPSADGVSQEEQAEQITDLLAGAAGTGWSWAGVHLQHPRYRQRQS